MQAEIAPGMVEQQPQRGRSEPPSARIRIADADAHLGIAVDVVDVDELHDSDESTGFGLLDRERNLRTVTGEPAEPVLVRRFVHRPVWRTEAREPRVVHPPEQRLGVVVANGAQPDRRFLRHRVPRSPRVSMLGRP